MATTRRKGGSSGRSSKGLPRGEKVIRWIEVNCRVPEGRDVGKPVRLREWQKAEIRRIYDNPAGTRRAILSFGRKNGKTSLAAFLLLVHICGPEARPNSQLYSTAQSREQAAIVFGLAAKIVRLNHEMADEVKIGDTAKRIQFPEIGTDYKALSADAPTAYGLSPAFIIHDELGQVRGDRSALYDALETAVGAQEKPLTIIISTQAPNDNDLLSVLIDDALAKNDPQTVVSLYTAPLELDPFSEEAIKAANPAYGDFLNAQLARSMAEDARRMKSREPEFRNLVLNQRVEMKSPFISRSTWASCGGPVVESFKGLPVWGGLDLSEVADLTALVLIAPIDGKWHVKPTFWLPEEGLREKARTDRVPYDLWHSEGLLRTTPGRAIEYEYVAHYLADLFADLDIRKIGFDRWNWRHLKPWLAKAGFSEADLDEKSPTGKFEAFGQGLQSMSPALRSIESDILSGKVAHGNHKVLAMCVANATVTPADHAGNRQLSKSKSTGRIDGAVALVMARGVAGTFLDVAPTFDVMAMVA